MILGFILRQNTTLARQINSDESFSHLDEITLKLVSELINVDMDGGDDNVCKAIEDLIKDSEAKGETKGEAKKVFKLRREGYISIEVAADELCLSIEEYKKREERFFS